MRVETENAWLLLNSFKSILENLGKIYSKEVLVEKALDTHQQELVACLEKISELDQVMKPSIGIKR